MPLTQTPAYTASVSRAAMDAIADQMDVFSSPSSSDEIVVDTSCLDPGDDRLEILSQILGEPSETLSGIRLILVAR